MKRGVVQHVAEAAKLHHSGRSADVVINCTGLSARKLGGVRDKKVYPARGQIVLVRNDPNIMASISGTDDAPDEATYIMHRAAGRTFHTIETPQLISPCRWRMYPRGLSTEGQLGISARSQSRCSNHETLR